MSRGIGVIASVTMFWMDGGEIDGGPDRASKGLTTTVRRHDGTEFIVHLNWDMFEEVDKGRIVEAVGPKDDKGFDTLVLAPADAEP